MLCYAMLCCDIYIYIYIKIEIDIHLLPYTHGLASTSRRSNSSQSSPEHCSRTNRNRRCCKQPGIGFRGLGISVVEEGFRG